MKDQNIKELEILREKIIEYWDTEKTKNFTQDIKELDYDDLIYIAAVTAQQNYIRWKQENDFFNEVNKKTRRKK